MLRFECQGGGECCKQHGKYSYVWLTEKDVLRLAKFFGIAPNQFVDDHCKGDRGYLRLDPKGTCQFLKGNKCSVHPARPRQCRIWPIEEFFDDERAEAVQKFCPGIGKGKEYTEEEIIRILTEDGEV